MEDMEADLAMVNGKFIEGKDMTVWHRLRNVYADKKNEKYHRHIAEALRSVARLEFQRNLALNDAEIPSGNLLAVRNVATSRLATFLGIQDIICDSRNAYIKSQGKMKGGIVMEHSGGKEAFDLYNMSKENNKNLFYSDNAIGDLFKLQIFDALCGQIDRNDANIHFTYHLDKKKNAYVLDKMKALDSDMSFGLVGHETLKEGYNRLVAVDEKSVMGLPIDLLNKLMIMPQEFINNILWDILEPQEMLMVGERLKVIRNVVSGLVNKGILTRDKKTGRYSYTKKDYQDDKLRQFLMLKEYEKDREAKIKPLRKKYGEEAKNLVKLRDFSYFINPHMFSAGGADELIQRRRAELAQGKK